MFYKVDILMTHANRSAIALMSNIDIVTFSDNIFSPSYHIVENVITVAIINSTYFSLFITGY